MPAALALLGASSAAPPPTTEQLERIAACGPAGKQAWICSTVYRLTGSKDAADAADTLAKPVKVLFIVAVAYLVVRVARRVIKRLVRQLQQDATGERLSKLRQRTGLALLDTSPVPSVRRALRAETIGAVLRSLVTAIVWTTAIVMILDELGVNLSAIGIGVSIVGIAVGFGAQSLVKDFLSGLFMIVEDQYGVGDVVDLGVATGTVEGVSLRTTRLRDVEGTVWHVPNGEVHRVGNKSQQWSRALVDVSISYDTDVESATQVLRAVAEGLCREPEYQQIILGEPEVWGVERLDPDRVQLRLVVKTKPLEQWRVARELRARLKRAFEEAGIGIPLGPGVTYRVDDGARREREPEPGAREPGR